MEKGINVLNQWKADIASLQTKLVELERSKKVVQVQIKETTLYQKRNRLTKDIRKARAMIEARSRELSGAVLYARAAGISLDEKKVEKTPTKIRKIS
jgi:hypothetical protein